LIGMRRVVTLLLPAILVTPCAPALAATVQIGPRTGYLVYEAARHERNDVRIAAVVEDPGDGATLAPFVRFTVEDRVPITPGNGCTTAHGGQHYLVRCDLERFGPVRAVVRLNDRDDRAGVAGDFDQVRLRGGPGDDTIAGGPSDDVLRGGRGADRLAGGRGVDELLAGNLGLDPAVTRDRLRGGPGSDLLEGSNGANLIDGGPGVDKVDAGGGRDTVLARDGTIEQIHCGGRADRARTDGFDYPLACEKHSRYSASSPVPLEFSAAAGESRVSLLMGCRESHRAACAGSVQLELGGRAISDELPFTFANRHRWVVIGDTSEPIPPDAGERPDFVVRVRAHDANGAPTDDRLPVPLMLIGDPFLGVRR
jgi:Ca2+-binding RTX toxin-like protein